MKPGATPEEVVQLSPPAGPPRPECGQEWVLQEASIRGRSPVSPAWSFLLSACGSSFSLFSFLAHVATLISWFRAFFFCTKTLCAAVDHVPSPPTYANPILILFCYFIWETRHRERARVPQTLPWYDDFA